MIKYLLSLIISLFLIPSSYSQSSVWKVEANGNVIYIGGTVHLLRAEDYPLPDEFYQAYKKADALVFETDLKEMEGEEIMSKLMVEAQYQDGNSLSKSLSPKVYSLLKEKMTEKGLPIESFESFKPSIIILTLSSLMMQQNGIDTEGVDQHFYKKAEEDKKNVMFLETVDEQIKMLTSMGEGNEDAFVLSSLEDLEEMNKGMEDLIADWKNGTKETMEKEIETMIKEYPNIYKTLLEERNKSWILSMNKFLESNEVEYILVGGMHLYGEQGILNILKKKKIKITQL